MLLRTQISLLGILVVMTVSAFILLASFEREDLIRVQYSKEVLSDQSNLWGKIKDEFIDDMADTAWILRDNRELISAIGSQDSETIRRIGRQVVGQLKVEKVADRLDIFDREGNLIYSTLSGVFQSSIISEEFAKSAIDNNSTVRGVGNDKQRNSAVVFGFPLIDDAGQVLGMGVMALDIIRPLAEMQKLNDSSTMILNRRGRLLVAPEPDVWEEYGEFIDLNEMGTLQTISKDDRFFSVTVLPQIADLGSLVGRLVSIEEVTDQVLQQRKIGRLTFLLIAVFTLLSLVSLYLYMRYAFVPLTEGVEVLQALARGDLMMLVNMRTGKDEVGQIGNAVNVFRSGMLMLNRYRRSRERQRARQERFIYREMTELADTLDGDDQEAMLRELDKIAPKIELKASSESIADSLITVDPTAEDFDPRVLHGSDSLVLMATAFHSMSARVRDQHQRLRDALATKQAFTALRKELDIATRVQLSLLPHRSEKSKSLEIVGGMWPAKEVGGDFFDYFRLDADHIGIAIADVSGKGVPAALFAVMARTSLRGMAVHVRSPSMILENINNFLEKHNDENLFITFFYGILNESTGRFTYANGGHNTPFLVDNREVIPLELTSGMVLGMFDEIEFDEASIDLKPGSRLVFFTDGIPEAFNIENEAYGDDRLLDVLSSLPDRGPGDDVKKIVGSVNTFVGTAPQFDDITCVILHYRGASQMDTTSRSSMEGKEMNVNLTLKHDLSEIPRVAEEIEQLGETNNWPMTWIFNANLALDELITNVISYGFKNRTDDPKISLSINQSGPRLTIILEDNGNPFDPFTEAMEPDVDAALDERAVGGLGVFFVKTLVDDAIYARHDDHNRVTLILVDSDNQ